MKKKLISGTSKAPVTEGIIGYATYTADNGSTFDFDLDSTSLNFQKGDMGLLYITGGTPAKSGSSIWWSESTGDVTDIIDDSRYSSYGNTNGVAAGSISFRVNNKGEGNRLRIINLVSQEWRALSAVVILFRGCNFGGAYTKLRESSNSRSVSLSPQYHVEKEDYSFVVTHTDDQDNFSNMTVPSDYTKLATVSNNDAYYSTSTNVFYKLVGSGDTTTQSNPPSTVSVSPNEIQFSSSRHYIASHGIVTAPFKWTMVAGYESGFLTPGYYYGRYGSINRNSFGTGTYTLGQTNNSTVELAASGDRVNLLSNVYKLNMLVVNGVEHPITSWRHTTSGTIGSRTYPDISGGDPIYVTGQTYECELKYVP